MKRKMLIAVMAGCMSLLAACSAQQDKAPDTGDVSPSVTTAVQEEDSQEAYHKITAEEAKKMMDEGGVTVVDVRTSEEYREKHIPDSILVPNESITTTQAPEELPDKDAVLLIHCRTGVRSKDASDKLVELGYKHVYDFGGIVDWPYETVSEVVGST